MLLRQPRNGDTAPLLVTAATARIQGALPIEPQPVTRIRRQPRRHLIGLLRRPDPPHPDPGARIDHTVALARVPAPSHAHHPRAPSGPARPSATGPRPRPQPTPGAPARAASAANQPPAPAGSASTRAHPARSCSPCSSQLLYVIVLGGADLSQRHPHLFTGA